MDVSGWLACQEKKTNPKLKPWELSAGVELNEAIFLNDLANPGMCWNPSGCWHDAMMLFEKLPYLISLCRCGANLWAVCEDDPEKDGHYLFTLANGATGPEAICRAALVLKERGDL